MERTRCELYDFIFCVGQQPAICIYVVHLVYRTLVELSVVVRRLQSVSCLLMI